MASLRIGRVFGIGVELHITFIILILLIALALAFFDFQNLFPIMILLFFLFLSVFLHELTHSLVAVSKGIKVRKITLLPIGGIAFTEEAPKTPRDEFLISVAGPLFNFMVVLAIVLVVFFVPFLFPPSFPFTQEALEQAVLSYPLFALMYVNLILGAFNLFLPALPLDGGRVLRSLLSMIIPPSKATSFVSKTSMVIAVILFVLGLFYNIVLAIIAVFIYFGASSEGEISALREILGGKSIRNLINRKPLILESGLTIEETLEEMEKEGRLSFLVELSRRRYGFISVESFKQIPKEKWKTEKIGSLAVRVPFISVDSDAAEVMTKFMTKGFSLLPVTEKGEVIGVIEQEKLAKAFQLMKLEKEASR